jgi:hypothetical protein
MIGGKLPNISFETFYASNDKPKNPLIPEIVKLGKKLKDKKLTKNSTIIISLGFGKRVLINTNVNDYSEIKDNELIEIVDYDPVKNNLLIIGQNQPRLESPVHWMIHHAREDVGAVIQINNDEIINKVNYPETEKEYLTGSFEQIKSVLGLLRDSKKIKIKNQGILFVGKTIQDLEKYLEDLI